MSSPSLASVCLPRGLCFYKQKYVERRLAVFSACPPTPKRSDGRRAEKTSLRRSILDASQSSLACFTRTNKKQHLMLFFICAGSENRTRVSTLGRSHSATKPYPPTERFQYRSILINLFHHPFSSVSPFCSSSFSSTITIIFSPGLPAPHSSRMISSTPLSLSIFPIFD